VLYVQVFSTFKADLELKGFFFGEVVEALWDKVVK
jgi:hypothetical protein